ncbi:MAG: hypothetical protein LC640_09020 [Frankia sp.]|nr:hypothetical protein [Frankia sp.]
MTRRPLTVAIEVLAWLAILVAASFLAACSPGPEGDYAGDVDPAGCHVTVGLHAGGAYTTGRVCPDEAHEFVGRWSLDGDTVRVSFDDGTAYDLRWNGDALVDADGASYRRAP